MQKNPERNKEFGAWESVPNFSVNGDRWTATSDGFMTIRIADNSTAAEYVYITDESLGGVVATVTLLDGPMGASFANSFPVRKGISYRLSTNISTAVFLFMPLNV
jgi:hypothetical protein